MNPYEKIKELTKQNGISVRELEKRLGYSNGYFSKWKNVSPNSDGLAKVADYFGVSIDYLLGRGASQSTGGEQLSEQEKKLLMRFRRGSKNLTDDEKIIYERQAMSLFDYINQTMHDLDEKNKPK